MPAQDAIATSLLDSGSKPSLLQYMFKYIVKAMPAEARSQALDASAKDGVAPFMHLSLAREFVAQAEPLERGRDAHELTHAHGGESPVQPAGLVANADHHVHATAAELVVGFGFNGLDYVLIVGAWRCAFRELRLHSGLSRSDVSVMYAVARYFGG